MKIGDFENFLRHLIARIKDGDKVEKTKLELKRQWYDFANSRNKKLVVCEFLKDIVALANTPGPEGYLIIGIDEKTGEIFHSPFQECGLPDTSELFKLIVKSVDLPFKFEHETVDLDGTEIAVLIVPPSLDKPHVIGHFETSKQQLQNYIPVRKTTGIFPASRSDLEHMFYDRKNIDPEYALDIKSYRPHITFSKFGAADHITVQFPCAFTNYGRKPIALVRADLAVESPKIIEPLGVNSVTLGLYSYKDRLIAKDGTTIRHRHLVVSSNNIEIVELKFRLMDKLGDLERQQLRDELNNAAELSMIIKAEDLNGNFYYSKAFDKERK